KTFGGSPVKKPPQFLLAVALGALVALPVNAAKDLVVGVPANLTGLDPQDVNDTLSQSAGRAMFQGLFGFDREMKLIPLLAESYEVDEAATRYTFRLRKG